MAAEDTFKADTETLFSLASNHWQVPEFQREFVWKDRQVRTLLTDVNDARMYSAEDYFLGAIVWFPDEEGIRVVIDGQQRLTTLYMLISALRDQVKALKLHESDEEGGELLHELEGMLRAKSIVKGVSKGQRNRLTLKYKSLNDTLIEIQQGKGSTMKLPQGELSRRRMIRAYQLCLEYVEKLEDDLTALQSFADWIGSSLLFVSVRAKDITAAYKVFETLNDRGQTLNAADLLKNLLFFKAQGNSDVQQAVNGKWADMEFQLQEAPETSKVRFLRYFVAANFDLGEERMVVASDLFDWIKEHPKELGTSQPSKLASRLAEQADAYRQFVRGRRADGSESPALLGIADQGTGVRQHLALLLASRHLPAGPFEDLCGALETLTFVLAVTRQPWNQLETLLPRWCSLLRVIPRSPVETAREGVEAFVQNEIKPWLDQSGVSFWQAMNRTDRVRDSLTRYALVEIEHEIRTRAKDKNEIPSNRTVEHIFPQSHTQQNITDFYSDPAAVQDADVKDVTYALGNLALLTTNENSVAGGKIFSAKLKEPYPVTAFRITAHLAVDMSMGKGTAIKKLVEEFDLRPMAAWNQTTLEKRQRILQRLMCSRWPLLPRPSGR